MSTVSQPAARTASGKKIGALILAIIGVLLLILAAMYMTTKAGSLPSFIPGYKAHSTGHHALRAPVAAVVGLLALAGAWWLGLRKPGK